MKFAGRRRPFQASCKTSLKRSVIVAKSASIGRVKCAFLMVVLTAIFLCVPARAGEVAQINLILDDGVALIYKGADYGFKAGDALDVMRAGQLIGRLEVTEVYPTFTRAKIVSQEKTIEVFDVVAKSTAPAPATMKKPTDGEKAAEKKEEKKPAAKKEEKKAAAEKKPAEKKPAPKKEEKKPVEKAEKKEEPKPAVVTTPAMPKTYTNVTLGYFYLNQDLDIGLQDEQKPVLAVGADYWMRGKPGKKRSASKMVGIVIAKPVIKITTPATPISINTKFMAINANYIIDDQGIQPGSKGSYYYGAGVSYRKLKFDNATAGGTLIGINGETNTGTDFNIILGYHFDKKSEFKVQYCVDEQYYSMTLGYRLR